LQPMASASPISPSVVCPQAAYIRHDRARSGPGTGPTSLQRIAYGHSDKFYTIQGEPCGVGECSPLSSPGTRPPFSRGPSFTERFKKKRRS
jgi:hypothetical protein